MRALLATLPAALLCAACAAPSTPTVAEPATVAALDTYKGCTRAAMGALQGTARPDPALQVARVAVAQCVPQREALRAAVVADNASSYAPRLYADTYVDTIERQQVAALADAMLRSR